MDDEKFHYLYYYVDDNIQLFYSFGRHTLDTQQGPSVAGTHNPYITTLFSPIYNGTRREY
jgi:hypothetical protein